MGMRVFQQKEPKTPGAHKIGAAISGPRKITDVRFFFVFSVKAFEMTTAIKRRKISCTFGAIVEFLTCHFTVVPFRGRYKILQESSFRSCWLAIIVVWGVVVSATVASQ